MKPKKNVYTTSCEKQVFSGEAHTKKMVTNTPAVRNKYFQVKHTKKMVNNTPFYNLFKDGSIAQMQC